MRQVVLIVLLCLSLPSIAGAWGGEGHQVVCLIAEERLTAAAGARIHDLLGKDVNISDAAVANWADDIRPERPQTSAWHFVDIPLDAGSFKEARDGREGNNVVDKINDFAAVLKNANASKPDRAEALKYLVHFVADVHQPLHCAERKGDRGGNTRLVFFLDEPRAVNLHFVWDVSLIQHRKGDARVGEYADKLNARITKEQAAQWAKGSATDWANESHAVAARSAYAGVPAEGPPPRLDARYVDAAGTVVDEQLERAGVRLAALLNRVSQ